MGYLTTALQGAVGSSLALNLSAANATNSAIAAAYAADPSAFEQGAGERVYGVPPVTQAGARNLSFRMARLFAGSSEIRFSMAPSSGDGPGSAGGIGGPPGSSDGGDGGRGKKMYSASINPFISGIRTSSPIIPQEALAFHKNMAWNMTSNDIALIYHAEGDPADDEWDSFIASSRDFARRGNKAIIFSDGGMPSTEQRADLTLVHNEWSDLKEDPRIAIVCKLNAFVRLCVSAINILHGGGKRLKFFQSLEGSFKWLDLKEADTRRVLNMLKLLKIGMP